jgi:hypothetical protein
MTHINGARAAGGAAGLHKTSLLGRNDDLPNAPEIVPAQAEILRNPRAVREARLELLREAIFEACGFIRLHAEACQISAEAGDNAGLIHYLGRLVLYANHAAKSGKELRDLRKEPLP